MLNKGIVCRRYTEYELQRFLRQSTMLDPRYLDLAMLADDKTDILEEIKIAMIMEASPDANIPSSGEDSEGDGEQSGTSAGGSTSAGVISTGASAGASSGASTSTGASSDASASTGAGASTSATASAAKRHP